MTAKRILFLLRQTPYQSSRAVEAIEAILVAGVFEQDVSVLFKGDGVWQLIKEQDGGAFGTRTVGKMLGALREYGVTKLFVCQPSLAERGLTVADLVFELRPLAPSEQEALIANQEAVLND